jgi:hypothetical protein
MTAFTYTCAAGRLVSINSFCRSRHCFWYKGKKKRFISLVVCFYTKVIVCRDYIHLFINQLLKTQFCRVFLYHVTRRISALLICAILRSLHY